MRKLAGSALASVGAILLLTAGSRYTLGALHADEARRAWEARVATGVVAFAWDEAPVRWAQRAKIGTPVARLIIPRLGLDEIVVEGVGERELDATPGHVPGSVLPGRAGNAIISAHRDRHFKRFDELAVGDTITTETDRTRTTWVIVDRRVIGKDAPALFRTRDATLTLTTCWPIRYLGSAPERLIVTAKPLATH